MPDLVFNPLKTKEPLIAPSILAADFTQLGENLRSAEGAGAQLLHIDVMDGMFVPNISFGAVMVDACRRATDLYRDVHLMIEQPERYVDDFVKAGAQNITIHAEATAHVHRVIQQIKAHEIQAGLAVNPLTPLHIIKDALPYLDLVLIMTVNPGFGGQSFIEASIERIAQVKAWRNDLGLDTAIQVDGGIAEKTVAKASQAGANILVAGSAVFNAAEGIAASLNSLSNLAASAY